MNYNNILRRHSELNHNNILRQYELNNQNIKIQKNKTISKNEFILGEQYILFISDKYGTREIIQVIYEGKRKSMNQNECNRVSEVTFGFRTITKPHLYYDISIGDIDVDCYFYIFST